MLTAVLILTEWNFLPRGVNFWFRSLCSDFVETVIVTLTSRFLLVFKAVLVCSISGCQGKKQLHIMAFSQPHAEIPKCQKLHGNSNLHFSCFCSRSAIWRVTKDSICDLTKMESPEKTYKSSFNFSNSVSPFFECWESQNLGWSVIVKLKVYFKKLLKSSECS